MTIRKSTLVRLTIFAVVGLLALVVVGVRYAQLPQQAGVGRYAVTVDMDSAGGLYPNANVTYRGTQVGRVTEVVTTRTGARAELSIDSTQTIPADLDAYVQGMSAVGEMYLNLVPRRAAGGNLHGGSRIPADRVTLAPDAGELLGAAQTLLASVPTDDLQTVIDESFTALSGQGPALRTLVQSVTALAAEARAAVDPTATLIDQLGPLLWTQEVSADAIAAWTSSLARVTGTLADSDAALRGVLDSAGPAAHAAAEVFSDLEPFFGMLLSNLVTVEQVGAVYNPGLEQILVLFPPLIAASQGAGLVNADDPGQNTFFANQLNDPPPCIEGFLPPSERRSPADTSPAPAPKDLYCKVAPDDPRSVRGARNLPCLEYPGYRAATVKLCRQKAGGQAPRAAATTGRSAAPAHRSAQTSRSGSSTTAPAGRNASTSRVKMVDFDPVRGSYVGDDGITYRVGGTVRGQVPTLGDMLTGRAD
ncbi:Mce family protein [Gordonia hirsuta DSM 44140 = NBRC 16056]|uniref:Mce family protein n=1 Tax=Gordonia hirsuta DSM 44140 = NBRC 16056 TaxID=1121927 RepID=L7L6H6_9ACTN|nr:MlaD family protein [Gordonia hirsuta]GAC56356.1 Mce family protein [Gordonia hirsuta DSM 44140 = NBRC 16056]